MPQPYSMIGMKSARDLFMDAERAALQRVKEGKALRLSPVAKVEGDEATVWLYDAIGSWFGVDPAEFAREVAALDAKVIHLRVNSPGGLVTDAEAMQTALQQHPAKVIAHIDGWAASAATTVSLGADEIEMADGAWWMIHNAWGCTCGGAKDMRDMADILEKMNTNIAADYIRKTGASAEQVKQWMDAETWFTAAEALEHGFADRIYRAEGGDNGEKDQKKTKKSENSASNTGEVDTARAARARALALAEAGY